FLCFFLISQLVRHQQFVSLYSNMMDAQYAAESGIALMQQQLRNNPQHREPLYFHQNGCIVSTQIIETEPLIEIESVSMGRYGVKQTLRAKINPQTFAIAEWSN